MSHFKSIFFFLELSNNSDNSARIGHSRLLSVRNLGGSPLCETPQAQTTCSSFDKSNKISIILVIKKNNLKT